MSEEKRRESAGRLASAIALPEWSLRRKLALALTIPMLLAATFGGLRVHSELTQSDNYSSTAKQVAVLRPAAGYLAAAERAIIVSRQRPALDDPGRVSAIDAVDVAGQRLADIGESADLTPAQQERLDSVLSLSVQLRDGKAYLSVGQATSQVRQLQRGVTELIDSIVAEQIKPEAKLAALQQALDGRVSLSMQQYQANAADPKTISLVDLSAELGVEQVIIDRLGSYLGTDDAFVVALNQQNAAHFGVVRNNDHDLGDLEAFEPYDELTTQLLNDIDSNLNSAASDARALAIANAVVTIALLLAAIFLALLVSRLLLNPIRRVREGALDIANERLPEMVAKIRAGEDPGDITPIPVTTHEEMGQLARAVDDMNRQAVHLASGEARLRSQVGEMFSTLSRRNTSLINQQLGLIERLEKDEEDPNRLESLFRLDHLASRMRRTADSLMVLADAPTATSDTDALALGDVFQAAMAGVQEYQRVQIESSPEEKVNGAASADVVHLMTELVDNALAFSPPTAPVRISTKQAGDSTIVEISDGGLGIAADVLISLNDDLRSGGEVTVETARRMGLLVVSRLAKRHGITVSLSRNARGGTTATVLLPPALLRGRPAPAPVKTRPGLTGITSLRPVPPAEVSEEITNEPEKKPLPVRAQPVPAEPAAAGPSVFAPPAAVPAAPEASEAPESRESHEAPAAREAQDAPDAPPASVDSIEAAINAVIRLPQRQPGATRTGGPMPGTATGSSGGSLFQRLKANGATPDQPEQPADRLAEPAEPGPVEPVKVQPSALDIFRAGKQPTGDDATPETTAEESFDEPAVDEPAAEVDAVDAVDEADDVEVVDEDVHEPAVVDAVDDATEDVTEDVAEDVAEDAAEDADEDEDDDVAELDDVEDLDDNDDEDDLDEDDLDEATDEVTAEAPAPKLDISAVALSTLQHAAEVRSENEARSGAALGSLAARLQAARAQAAAAEQPAVPAPVAEVAATEEVSDDWTQDRAGETAEVAIPVAAAAGASWVAEASSNGTPAPPAAPETAYDLLDSRSPIPELVEDETPIFRNLKSNWFTSDGTEGTWSTSEIEAGWEAAEQVAEAPALQLSQSGLPMRRPGNRLVPGGVAPAAAPVARDPEAIRARLAAHAAGVSRGRTAAVDDTLTAPTTEEGPA